MKLRRVLRPCVGRRRGWRWWGGGGRSRWWIGLASSAAFERLGLLLECVVSHRVSLSAATKPSSSCQPFPCKPINATKIKEAILPRLYAECGTSSIFHCHLNYPSNPAATASHGDYSRRTNNLLKVQSTTNGTPTQSMGMGIHGLLPAPRGH